MSILPPGGNVNQGRIRRNLPFKPLSVRLWLMDKAEIKQIADYPKELEEGLYEWDYQGLLTLGELARLHEVIRRLMDATFKAKDQGLKVLLATLEYKARTCKDCIETRLAVRN